GRNHASDAVVIKRVDRGLARGAAAEIASTHNNSCVVPGNPIERKLRPFAVAGVKTQIAKQHFSMTALARQLEIARGQDLVCVDILGRKGTRYSRNMDELFQAPSPLSFPAPSTF